ncbi:hypothetical protein MTO96_003358 [Rhipicephalus appendiculatus]
MSDCRIGTPSGDSSLGNRFILAAARAHRTPFRNIGAPALATAKTCHRQVLPRTAKGFLIADVNPESKQEGDADSPGCLSVGVNTLPRDLTSAISASKISIMNWRGFVNVTRNYHCVVTVPRFL